MQSPVSVAAFYSFCVFSTEEVTELYTALMEFGNTHDIRGLVLVATEGINGTVSAPDSVMTKWKAFLDERFPGMRFNDSQAPEHVFGKWIVEVRDEIVSLKQEDIKPLGKHKHLSPHEFDAMLEQDDVVLIDTRNTYEIRIGTFKNALNPNIRTFHEFPDYVKQANIPKDKKVLMCCTGGIRCEKALLEMERQGYEHVYQLEGGILSYIKELPNKNFEGECFVFDDRIAVGQALEPSTQYKRCPHCGDPADSPVSCSLCKADATVCQSCIKIEERRTCSKHCRNRTVQLNTRKAFA